MNKETNARHRKCHAVAKSYNTLRRLNKFGIVVGFAFLVMVLSACSQQEFSEDSEQRLSNTNSKEITEEPAGSLTLGVLSEMEDVEQIGNQIPQWVMDADWDTPMYVVSSPDIAEFDSYAKENFPLFYDWGWTQEQSDSVYLGLGIEIINLDDGPRLFRTVYYPVVLNGVIVSVYQVYEDLNSQELHFQAAPHFVNELNELMSMTGKDTPLILGYNNNNLIGIIGDTYYVLDIDHVDHKQVDVDKIPTIEIDKHTVVDAMEILCAERTTNVDVR